MSAPVVSLSLAECGVVTAVSLLPGLLVEPGRTVTQELIMKWGKIVCMHKQVRLVALNCAECTCISFHHQVKHKNAKNNRLKRMRTVGNLTRDPTIYFQKNLKFLHS